LKGFDHQFKALVSTPFTEGQNPMIRISAAGEIWKLRLSREDAMRSQMDVIAAIFFVQDIAVSRHEYRHRIRQQHHSRSEGARQAVSTSVANPGVFQIHRIHQMVQRDVCVATHQP
jgi:hypothetical protein